MAAKKKTAENPSFEEALDRLSTVIERLESDDLPLDAAIGAFEEGVGLLKTCEGHLRGAEGTLRELIQGENGQLVERLLGPLAQAVTEIDE